MNTCFSGQKLSHAWKSSNLPVPSPKSTPWTTGSGRQVRPLVKAKSMWVDGQELVPIGVSVNSENLAPCGADYGKNVDPLTFDQ